MDETYLKVGSYMPGTGDTEAVIEREYYRQGYIFKDEEAFLYYPDRVCYVPELSDSSYTRQDFLDLCNGQLPMAEECFQKVDWQHLETWIDEQYREHEWGYCPVCGKIYGMAGEVCACPVCGWSPEEGEENADREGKGVPAESGGV